jgi:hypothetical protein
MHGIEIVRKTIEIEFTDVHGCQLTATVASDVFHVAFADAAFVGYSCDGAVSFHSSTRKPRDHIARPVIEGGRRWNGHE